MTKQKEEELTQADEVEENTAKPQAEEGHTNGEQETETEKSEEDETVTEENADTDTSASEEEPAEPKAEKNQPDTEKNAEETPASAADEMETGDEASATDEEKTEEKKVAAETEPASAEAEATDAPKAKEAEELVAAAVVEAVEEAAGQKETASEKASADPDNGSKGEAGAPPEKTVEEAAEHTLEEPKAEVEAEDEDEDAAREAESKAREKTRKKADKKGAKAEEESKSDEDEEEESQEESFEALLEKYDQFKQYRPGDVVKGTVVSIGEQEVLIDIGARVEGMIPSSELKDKDGNLTVSDGDPVTAMVCRFTPDGQYIPLSFERARVSRVWDDIEEIANKEKVLEGTVIEKVKGGFIVDVGVRAFLPTSQASLKPQRDLQNILGKKLEFTILKIQRRRGNLILSRREILHTEYEGIRKKLFEKLQEGAVLEGTVKNITDYGVFIDLGGLDGLLHITDMSWGRVNHPKDLVELNQTIEVKVLRFDQDKEKVSLGLKQCTPDPWLSVSEKYPPSTSCIGKVLNLTSYGAFVELEPGVEGMIHVSELSWTKKIRNPAQVLNKGQEVSVRVLDLDTENRRVSLSLKQTDDNPWESLAERFPVGSRVFGKVRNITDFGAFVEIEDGIDGLVHVSDFKWGERNADPNEFVKKGEEVEVVILAVDTDNRKVSLGIKQLEQDPWIEFTKHYKVGQVLTAPVSKTAEFGVFLKLSDHVEGLIRQNELDPRDKSAGPIVEGEEITAMITRISYKDRKVDLSQKKLHHHQERQAVMEYNQKNDEGGATIGDILSKSHDLKKYIK